MVLNLEIIRIVAALIGTSIAAYQDSKTSFIDDKVLFSMIGIGAVLTLLSFNQTFILYTFAVAALIFALGYLLYKSGQLGMGDVLLFAGLQLLLPLAPSLVSNFFGIESSSIFSFVNASLAGGDSAFSALGLIQYSFFITTIFLVSSYFATVGSSVFYLYGLLHSKKPLKPNFAYLVVSLALCSVSLYYLFLVFGFSSAFLLFVPLFLSFVFFLSFKEQIMDDVIIRKIKISQIEDEDILAVEKMPSSMMKKYNLQRVLTKKEVEKLKLIEKKEKMHSFPVCKVLPRLAPYILFGLVVALIFGDIFSLAASLFLGL